MNIKTKLNYWAFALIALALFTLTSFAQDAAAVVATPEASQAPAWLLDLVNKYPVLSVIVFAVGCLRMLVKPVMAFLHERAAATETKEDDEKLAAVENSKWWKWLTFGLDYVASIKLKK